MKTYTKQELKDILELHNKQLNNEDDGVTADLDKTNLSRANLGIANLYGANLREVDLHGANITLDSDTQQVKKIIK